MLGPGGQILGSEAPDPLGTQIICILKGNPLEKNWLILNQKKPYCNANKINFLIHFNVEQKYKELQVKFLVQRAPIPSGD